MTGKQKIKIIAVDMDGTLLNEEKQFTKRSKEVLRKAMDQGVYVVPATGRSVMTIPGEVKEFPGIRYAITANGARLVDMKENKVLYEKLLPESLAKQVLTIFAKYDTIQEVYYDGNGYTDEKKILEIEDYDLAPAMKAYLLNTRVRVPDIWEVIRQKNGQSMDKVQALFRKPEEQLLAWAEIEQMGNVTPVASLGINIEVNLSGVDKGSTLLKLGEMLGIETEEIMACGDADNDVTMVARAGLGVAMKNANEKVKAVADYVTESNDNEGVARAIEKFVLECL